MRRVHFDETFAVTGWTDGIEAEGAVSPLPGAFIDVDDAAPVERGMVVDPAAGTISAHAGMAALHLAWRRADRLAEIADIRWRVETGGIVVHGIAVATDDRSKTLLNGAYRRAEKDATFTTRWAVGPSSFVDLGADQIIGLGDAVSDHVDACFRRWAELAARVEAAATLAELEAIDITAGWPGGAS